MSKSSNLLPTPETYTVAEAAHILGIPARTAYAMIDSGNIPSLRIGNRILILRVVVQSMLDAGALEPEHVGDGDW